MGRLLDLATRLAATAVPSVPSEKNQGEPLQPAPELDIPPVPSVPPPESLSEAEQTEQRPDPNARHTAATASPEWIAARDAFHAHALGCCPNCHPPSGRYCSIGITLRGKYEGETLRKWNP